jgi:hypothetical protein
MLIIDITPYCNMLEDNGTNNFSLIVDTLQPIKVMNFNDNYTYIIQKDNKTIIKIIAK